MWELRKEDSFETQQSWLVSPCPNWSMEKWMSVILKVGIYSWENTSEDTPDILPIISGLLCLYFYIFDFILYVAARMFLKNTNLLILLSCLKFFGGFHSAFKTLNLYFLFTPFLLSEMSSSLFSIFLNFYCSPGSSLSSSLVKFSLTISTHRCHSLFWAPAKESLVDLLGEMTKV